VHVDAHPVVVCCAAGGDMDPTADGGVPGGVLQQVVDHLVEPCGIGRDGQVGGLDVDDPAHVAAPGGQGRGIDHLVQEGGELDRLDVEVDHAGIEAGEIQQMVHQLGEPLGLGQRHLEGGRV